MELPQQSAAGSPSPANQSGTLPCSTSPEVHDKPLVVHTRTDASSTPTTIDLPTASNDNGPVIERERFPQNLPQKLGLVLGQNGNAYAVMNHAANPHVLPVGCSKRLNNIIREAGRNEGVMLRKAEISEINNSLQAHAETAGIYRDVWYRVAPISGGIEIDLGDEKHTRARITAGQVELVTQGSDALFYRTPVSQPFVMPAEVGNLDLLKKYLNLHSVSAMLFTAWLTYTLAHPKLPTTKFVILVLQGNQGSGKTALCNNVIQKLIDPSEVGVRILPSNGKDFAIAAQNAHVLCYDNVRGFKLSMADMLCIAATGGALTTRQLYSDADQHVLYLHVALVLNGIHSFIDQPDLAQRCLPLQLLPISESNRKSEGQLVIEFQADSPAILRGLFDLIADILTHLPTAEITNPERMIDFVRWLAAMEKAQGVPPGTFQMEYSNALNQGQLDSLLENLLAAAMLEFAEVEIDDTWSGTPSDLLAKLNARANRGTQRSREWPQNPISLSKKLVPLQASLLTQGIRVDLRRGKHRAITINKLGAQHD